MSSVSTSPHLSSLASGLPCDGDTTGEFCSFRFSSEDLSPPPGSSVVRQKQQRHHVNFTCRFGRTGNGSSIIVHLQSRTNMLSTRSGKLHLPKSFFQDLIRDLARDVTSSSVLCLRMALTDIPILVDCRQTFHKIVSMFGPKSFVFIWLVC